jgi:hypothetical protein
MIMSVCFITASTHPVAAQGDCGRSLMLDTRNTGATNVYTEACKNSIEESKLIQQQAQARLEARNRWNALDPQLRSCLDGALKMEGSSIEFRIRDGIMPSYENTAGYLNERKTKC